MESTPSNGVTCPACSNIGRVGAIFCSACGVGLSLESRNAVALPVVRAQQAWLRVRSAAFCYLALLVVVVVSMIAHDAAWTAWQYAAPDLAMATVLTAFAWPLRSELVGLLRVPRMDSVAWALLLLGPPLLWGLNQTLISAVHDVPGVWVADPVQELHSVGASLPAIVFLICITPPLLEEMAFRGFLFESIRESFGNLPAAIVLSALFSILHVALLSFIPLAALALVLAALRLRTGSLWPSILGHAMFNAISLMADFG